MLEWMLMPVKRYADFKGRSRRKEYWSFFLLSMIVMVVIMALRSATGPSMMEVMAENPDNPLAIYGWMYGGVGMLLALWTLATFVPNIALNVRRLHDRDMSGWWLLGFFVGMIIPIINIVASIAYLVFMFLPGTAGPNRFGPDPKNPTSADVFN